jgi:Replication initiation factor
MTTQVAFYLSVESSRGILTAWSVIRVQTDNALLILESGIDWLTVTAPRGESADSMIALADPLLHQQVDQGNRVSLWKGSGYHGRTSGAVSLGVGREGSIVTLKSREAFLSAEPFLGGGYRVTRLDLQTTCFDESKMADRWQAEYYALLAGKKKAGRPISANLRLNSGGGSTLYLGSAKSDIIARAYDKGVESKIAEAGECQRYEVQFRRRYAKLQAERLYQSKDKPHHTATIVTRFFQARGITVPRVAEQLPGFEVQHEALYSKRAESDSERSLRWLGTLVAPTVKRLIDSGQRDKVLRALGLTVDEK